MKLVCLASGRGSNFKAIAEACRSGQIPNAQVVALLSNNTNAVAVATARQNNLPVEILEKSTFLKNDGTWDRSNYDHRLAELALKYSPDYVILAGYLLVLGSAFLSHFPDRVLNIHPSLLPLFPGLFAQRQALAAQAKKTGCTVHLVDARLDGGPILAQAEIVINTNDTEATLIERLLPVEHQTYVAVLRRLAKERFVVEGKQVRWVQRP